MNLQVGVKVLLKNERDEYLFLRRTEAFHNETEPHWDIPGGRIDPSEALELALQREVLEETGLQIKGTPLLLAAQDIFVEPKNLHVVRLTYTATSSGSALVSDEHQETCWASPEKALALNLDPYLREVLEQRLSADQ